MIKLLQEIQNQILVLNMKVDNILISLDRTEKTIEKQEKKVISTKEFNSILKFVSKDKYKLVFKIMREYPSLKLESILRCETKNINREYGSIEMGHLSLRGDIFDEIVDYLPKGFNGYIFYGTHTNPINPKTLFRVFSKAAEKAGLGKGLSPIYLKA